MRIVMTAVLTAVLPRFVWRISVPGLIAVWAICAVIATAMPHPAHAFSDEELRNVTEKLNVKSATKKIKAIDAMAADGDPRVAPILNAMLEGNLFVRDSDEHVVIGAKKGKVWSHIDIVRAKLLERFRELRDQGQQPVQGAARCYALNC